MYRFVYDCSVDIPKKFIIHSFTQVSGLNDESKNPSSVVGKDKLNASIGETTVSDGGYNDVEMWIDVEITDSISETGKAKIEYTYKWEVYETAGDKLASMLPFIDSTAQTKEKTIKITINFSSCKEYDEDKAEQDRKKLETQNKELETSYTADPNSINSGNTGIDAHEMMGYLQSTLYSDKKNGNHDLWNSFINSYEGDLESLLKTITLNNRDSAPEFQSVIDALNAQIDYNNSKITQDDLKKILDDSRTGTN